MQGRVYQRTPGRGRPWTIVYDIAEAQTGVRRRVSKGGFSTRKGAEAALFRAVADAQSGVFATRPDQRTLAEFLREEWLPVQAGRGLRPTTLSQYRWSVEHSIVPHLGTVQLARLTPKAVQGLYDTLRTSGSTRTRGGGLSARSVQLTATILKMALDYAVKHGMLPRNPAALVDRPRVTHHEMSAWTNAETIKFLAFTADDRLAAAWRLFLTLGPRRGEVAGLRWADVDLDAGRARLVHTLVVVEGRPVSSTPKTAAGRRSVPLDPDTVAMLRKHAERQGAERQAAGSLWTATGYVFTDQLGQPVHPEHMSNRFETLIKEAGLRRIRLHDARHTAATGLLEDGTPTKVAAELLGHASPTITQTIYQHVVPGMTESAVARRAAALADTR